MFLVAEVGDEAAVGAGSQGGTITIEADGNFTYHPDDVDTAITDTFTYRVCDAAPAACTSNGRSTSTLARTGRPTWRAVISSWPASVWTRR